MEKMPTLFSRNMNAKIKAFNEVTLGCEWVEAGEGVATEKVDGAVALVMALDRAMKNQGGESVYDTRGLLII